MKRHYIIILLAFFGFLKNISAQNSNFIWAKKTGGTSADYGYSIAVDASGNVYTTGSFSGTVDFNPGTGTYNLTSVGLLDIFISKLDASGNFLWATSIGGSYDDAGNSIALNAFGNVYITGSFVGTVDFDPGPGTQNLTSTGGAVNDIFVLKLDPSGGLLWAKNMGGTGDDQGNSIAVDASGNIYTTGSFVGTGDFDPGPGVYTLTDPDAYWNTDVFVSKLDASGNFEWAKNFGGNLAEGLSISVDASGNVYTTGQFLGIVDFDPGPIIYNLTASGFVYCFISKLDASGNFVWAKLMGNGGYNSSGNSVAVDVSGNVYTTGFFEGAGDFDPSDAGIYNLSSFGSYDIFISKLDASGNFVWAKNFGAGFDDISNSIAVDASGSLYTTGYFSGTVDFDPGPGIANLTSTSGVTYILKLDALGNFVWVKNFGGDSGNSIIVDALSNVYVTGYFSGTKDFDPGSGISNLISSGSYDIFVVKLGLCTPPSTPTITAGTATTFCQGGSVTLTSNAANGNQWYKDGVAIGGSTATTYIANASGSYTVKVTVNGCVSSTSNAIIVTVNPTPSTPTITAGTVTTFCQGGSVTLTSNTANGNQWYKDGVAIGGSTATTYIANTSGSYTVIVTLNGCVSATSNAIIVTVNPIPSTPTITAGATTTFCQGGSVTLTSNAASGNQWYKDGVAINGSTGTTLNVNASGNYTVKVTVNGCESSASNAIAITVNAAPATPIITTGGAITFCTGGSVTLTSNAASGNQWYKDGVAINGSTGTTLNVTASGNYTVKVTVNGCESAASNAISITVNAAPATPIITAGGAITFCTGGSVTLTSNAASGNQWYKDGVAINGSTGTTLNVTASGIYTVKVTANGCESAASNSIVVTVSAIPSTPIITAGGVTTFCQGGSVTLTSNAASGNQWYKDGVVINGSTGTTLNVTASGSYTVKVTVNGCESSASNAIAITVNAAPATPIITAGGAITFCTGGSVTLTSNAASGNQWYKDGVAINGSTGTTLNVTASGSYTVKVTVNGCESAASNAIVVTVSAIPSTPIITAGGVTTFCQGGSVTLTSNAASGNQWYKDGVVINGSTGTTLNVTASGNYTVKVTVNGCESAASNAISITVNAAPATPIITAGGAITFCTGGSVTLTSNAASGNQWYKDGVAINGSTGTILNVTAGGIYTVKITANGCESLASNAISVTVNTTPSTPTISQNGNQIVSNASSGNQWYLNAVIIVGATSQNYTPVVSGDYTVQVTLNNCTSAFSTPFSFTVTAIPNINVFDDRIKILPNPVEDKLIITQSGLLSQLSIRLFDYNGKLLKQITSGLSKIEIEMEKYAAGPYIVWIEDKTRKIRGKKIIVKL